MLINSDRVSNDHDDGLEKGNVLDNKSGLPHDREVGDRVDPNIDPGK